MFDGLRYPLPTDESKILVCPACEGKNRLPLSRALEQPDKARCGRCQAPLLAPQPVELRARL